MVWLAVLVADQGRGGVAQHGGEEGAVAVDVLARPAEEPDARRAQFVLCVVARARVAACAEGVRAPPAEVRVLAPVRRFVAGADVRRYEGEA